MIRAELAREDTWDLSTLFKDDTAWNEGLVLYEKMAERIPSFKGTLSKSADCLNAYLEFFRDLSILEERLGVYSGLRQSEDEGDSIARTMTGRFIMATTKVQAASAWAVPEIQAIPDADIHSFLAEPCLAEFTVYLAKLLRYKPHILSASEERILALHSEAESAVSEAFSVLTNVDIDFGSVDTPNGPCPLSQSTWSLFMESPDRELRKQAYTIFYRHFDSHKTTIATLYGAQVKQNVIKARIRNFPSARAATLFPDNVAESVYDNLIATVHENLPVLHRYYALRKRMLKLDELRHYDVYTPLVPAAVRKTRWDEAVDLIAAALSPLGCEYVDILTGGLRARWADRYENKGKRSGAFSSGSFTGAPYILMNYKEDSIRDVFTLAHEGGHSMHSWYSARSNPFMHYSYTIFEAEVASTFNEELLFQYLLKTADDPSLKRFLINKRTDEILATLYRQTMFAEYEKRTHELEEAGVPLTIDILRNEYRQLLIQYFGPEMVLEEFSDLECLRIPHFYNAFYVYKYATGISAALALARRVLSGGTQEREDYFAFLKSGGSHYPLESLKIAGVDMNSPEPIQAACAIFGHLVDQLETN
ncbi:MAG: oligoendopeptidase F [Spirochaetaceae bacterium]|jgi:oligoendopeptidase F|nr:oligoendopeptidase F [Spirochaetaceae bacterium]